MRCSPDEDIGGYLITFSAEVWRRIVRRLFRDPDVVGVGLAQTGVGDLKELGFLLEFRDGPCPEVTHAGLEAPSIWEVPGGKQVVIEDPSGNPIEVFEPRA